MEGNQLVKYLNSVSGGEDYYGYDEQSSRLVVIDNNGVTTIMSMDRAFNELKEKTWAILEVTKNIFRDMVEDKPAGNGGKDNDA